MDEVHGGMDGMSDEAARREFLTRIARDDYTLVSVREEWARDRSWMSHGFVYSVGLWEFHRAPELIVVGASHRHGTGLVTRYAELVKSGRRFDPGGPYLDFLPGAGVLLELVAPALYPSWFAQAFEFYPAGDFPALQLLWPDRNGQLSRPVLTASGRLERSRRSS